MATPRISSHEVSADPGGSESVPVPGRSDEAEAEAEEGEGGGAVVVGAEADGDGDEGFAVAVPKLLRKLIGAVAPLENINWEAWFHDVEYGYGSDFEDVRGRSTDAAEKNGIWLFLQDYRHLLRNLPDFSSFTDDYDYDDHDYDEYLSTYESEEEQERGRTRTRTMLTARDMIEPSTRKRSKSKGSKSEKARATDETPEEKEARREERRMKKVERQARQEVEALALLGLPRMRRHKVGKEKKKGESKGKEILVEPPTPKESKSEKKTKVSVKEVISNGFPAKYGSSLAHVPSCRWGEIGDLLTSFVPVGNL